MLAPEGSLPLRSPSWEPFLLELDSDFSPTGYVSLLLVSGHRFAPEAGPSQPEWSRPRSCLSLGPGPPFPRRSMEAPIATANLSGDNTGCSKSHTHRPPRASRGPWEGSGALSFGNKHLPPCGVFKKHGPTLVKTIKQSKGAYQRPARVQKNPNQTLYTLCSEAAGAGPVWAQRG